MLTVTADLYNGLVFPERTIEEKITALALAGEDFSIGGTVEMLCLRILVKRKVIEPMRFKFNDQLIYVDKDGNLESSPIGFFDLELDWLMEVF